MTCPHRKNGQCQATPPDGGVCDCDTDCRYVEELLESLQGIRSDRDRCLRYALSNAVTIREIQEERDRALARAERLEADLAAANRREDLLWRCIRELAVMLDRDQDGIEEIAIEKDVSALVSVLDV